MDNDAMTELYKSKMKLIYKYLRKNGCSHSDAEDIVQDAFYQALRYIEGIDVDKISAWLFRVSINKFYDLCRTKSRHVILNINEEDFIKNLAKDYLCEDYVLNMEKNEEVKNILNSLKNSYRSLLILKYEIGLSYREIASVLDIKETKVKTYLYRARNQFKKRWEEFGYER